MMDSHTVHDEWNATTIVCPKKNLCNQKIVLNRIMLSASLAETRFSGGKYLKIEKMCYMEHAQVKMGDDVSVGIRCNRQLRREKGEF